MEVLARGTSSIKRFLGSSKNVDYFAVLGEGESPSEITFKALENAGPVRLRPKRRAALRRTDKPDAILRMEMRINKFGKNN